MFCPCYDTESSQQTYEIRFSVPILQIRKLKLKMVKQIPQDHIVSMW